MSNDPNKPGGLLDKTANTPAKDMSGDLQEKALAFFMDDDMDEQEPIPLKINVAPINQKEKWIELGLLPISRDALRAIRRRSTKTDGGQSVTDESEMNLQIATLGIATPDLSDPENRKIKGVVIVDPAEFLTMKFSKKPGLIDQIAGNVLEISGFSDKDVKEIAAAKN